PVYMALISQIFGPASFGLVLGIAGMVMLPVGFAAPPLAGALRDAHGNYEAALLLFAGGVALAALLLAGLRPGPRAS
ncbi:MAG: MFS transporter, partial [Myxococcota bacterium]